MAKSDPKRHLECPLSLGRGQGDTRLASPGDGRGTLGDSRKKASNSPRLRALLACRRGCTVPSKPARVLKIPARTPERDEFDRRLAGLLRSGGWLPCAGRDEWTSENVDDRADAAQCCGWCPLLDACRALAEAEEPKAGVWAGTDYEQRHGT